VREKSQRGKGGKISHRRLGKKRGKKGFGGKKEFNKETGGQFCFLGKKGVPAGGRAYLILAGLRPGKGIYEKKRDCPGRSGARTWLQGGRPVLGFGKGITRSTTYLEDIVELTKKGEKPFAGGGKRRDLHNLGTIAEGERPEKGEKSNQKKKDFLDS